MRNRFVGFYPTIFLKIHYTEIIEKKEVGGLSEIFCRSTKEACGLAMFARASELCSSTDSSFGDTIRRTCIIFQNVIFSENQVLLLTV